MKPSFLFFLVDHFSKEVNFFISVSLVLLLLSTALILFILISRLVKSYFLRKRTELKNIFQEVIYDLSIGEKNHLTKETALNLIELKKSVESRFNQQVLIDELVHARKNVVGVSAQNIHDIYTILDLHKNSLKKLRGRSWAVKARGIRELAEMDSVDAIPAIQLLLHSGQQTIREEAILALIRLSKNNTFSFIDGYKGEITPWMEINMHKHLLTLDVRNLPLFSHWFEHTNTSISAFSIKMARLFRQHEALPKLFALLSSSNKKLVLLATEALMDMASEEYAPVIANTLKNFWDYDLICIKLIKTLGAIGDPTIHSEYLIPFLSHPEYEVRLETVRALEQLDGTEKHLPPLEENKQMALKQMISHVNAQLLQ